MVSTILWACSIWEKYLEQNQLEQKSFRNQGFNSIDTFSNQHVNCNWFPNPKIPQGIVLVSVHWKKIMIRAAVEVLGARKQKMFTVGSSLKKFKNEKKKKIEQFLKKTQQI